ncbi:hypothetical protein MMC11_007926 [Xylographa trunciseda]|nr:hypothetical protein [Xylographa trunciseda]
MQPLSAIKDIPIIRPTLSNLPPEIRNQIYDLLFCGLTILLLPNESLVSHATHHYKFRQNQPNTATTHRLTDATAFTSTCVSTGEFAFDELEIEGDPASLSLFQSSRSFMTEPSSGAELLLCLSLLTVSRQFYQETASLLYTHNTFRVQSRYLFNFLHHRTPVNLRNLRRVSISEILCSKLDARLFRQVLVAAAGELVQLWDLELHLVLGLKLWQYCVAHGGKAQWLDGVRAWRGKGLRAVTVKLSGTPEWVLSGKDPRALEVLGWVLEQELLAPADTRAGVKHVDVDGQGS